MADIRSNDDFHFLSQPEYFDELTRRVMKAKKGDRVALMSMGFEMIEPHISNLFHELTSAAGRGVNIAVGIDAHDFIFANTIWPGPLFFHKQFPEKMPNFYRQNLDAIERLKNNGGRVAILNRPVHRLRPSFVGRSHIKHALVNNQVYIGGCNLDNNKIDVMVRWEDTSLADWLFDFTGRAVHSGSVRRAMSDTDISLPVDDISNVIIDAGLPKQSTILRAAWKLIDDADESILLTCQFVPDSPTMKRLAAARQRGVKVQLLYDHPNKHRFPSNLPHYAVYWRDNLTSKKTLLKGQLPKGNALLHAKVIATEKAAIVGSHNYVQAGVTFGTAEIALIRHDPEFAKQVSQFVCEQIK